MAVTRIYESPEAFRRSNPLLAGRPCPHHGHPIAECECTRYGSECDLGGCIKPATHHGLNKGRDGRVRERRLICADDVEFATQLGMHVVPLGLTYDDVPEYRHVPGCQWAHISRWCETGCAGGPTSYEAALDAVGVMHG